MAILTAALVTALNTALADAGFTRAVTWQQLSAGVLGAAQDLTVTVESDQKRHVWMDTGDGSQHLLVRTVQVRLSGASTANLGDKLNYDGAAFTITDIAGTDDRPLWTASVSVDYGRGTKDRFRAEGRT